jgi:Glycosyl transferase family 2
VVIPAYQAEGTLGATLASVAAQSVRPSHVVIGDDGSTDGTVAIARTWESHLPIEVVRTGSNLGPAGARHAAIGATTSALVALLDADDVWLPDHLESMVSTWATTEDGLATADVLRWIPGRAVSARPLSAGSTLPPPGDQLAWLLRENLLSVASLFSRSRYEDVGGFRLQFRGTEDWDLWIRLVRAGAVIVRPDHPTVLYRLRHGSVSSAEAMLDARLDVLRTAAREVADASAAVERRALRAGERLVRAEAHLGAAYAAAAAGRSMVARLESLRSVRGVRSVAVRGLAMAMAPGAVARRREDVRHDPDVWLRRYGPGGS